MALTCDFHFNVTAEDPEGYVAVVLPSVCAKCGAVACSSCMGIYFDKNHKKCLDCIEVETLKETVLKALKRVRSGD